MYKYIYRYLYAYIYSKSINAARTNIDVRQADYCVDLLCSGLFHDRQRKS